MRRLIKAIGIIGLSAIPPIPACVVASPINVESQIHTAQDLVSACSLQHPFLCNAFLRKVVLASPGGANSVEPYARPIEQRKEQEPGVEAAEMGFPSRQILRLIRRKSAEAEARVDDRPDQREDDDRPAEQRQQLPLSSRRISRIDEYEARGGAHIARDGA